MPLADIMINVHYAFRVQWETIVRTIHAIEKTMESLRKRSETFVSTMRHICNVMKVLAMFWPILKPGSMLYSHAPDMLEYVLKRFHQYCENTLLTPVEYAIDILCADYEKVEALSGSLPGSGGFPPGP
eukprot:PhF_6_TR40218/c1_g1_i4/m.59740